MSAGGLAAMLVDLGAAGVVLRVSPAGTLQHRPADLPANLFAGLAAHRLALVAVLQGFRPAGAEAGYVMEERLGIAEGLGMPVQRGGPAWLVAVGEALQASRSDEAPDAAPAAFGHEPEACAGGAAGMDVTQERLEASGTDRAARRYVDEAWRRVRRLERSGVTGPDAIAVVFAAMNETPARTTGNEGCVTVTGAASLGTGPSEADNVDSLRRERSVGCCV